MKPLEKTSRNQLEKTVREAREIAETAARIALEQLGVAEATPFTHLSESERELRRRLRVHGRQLGDSLNGDKVQTMDRLIEEVAYEHWHRMLFARFLAENNLLMYPDPSNPVSVTLEECEELAAKEGAKNGWELAARFAAHMLPQIFRPNSPIFQLSLPPEHQQKLEQLIDELSSEVFTASDSLGWVYQFWQAKKKDEVNASEVKIGAHELPAVTQLFTEPYMVSFLLDNSLGAWWAARRLTKNEIELSKSEGELRQKASLPGLSLEFLRFVKGEDAFWSPSAGSFSAWPKHLSEFKILDPCCGSGHFLVAAFLMLVPMRMEIEKLSAREAVDDVLRNNLHGLEIDRRCVELAAFALALAAWRYPNAGGYRQLPEINVACSGLAIAAKKEEWLTLAGDNVKLRYALGKLHDQFKDAPLLGSLINPEMGLSKGTLVEIEWKDVEPLLAKAFSGECDDEKTEMGVVAQGIAKAAFLLANKFHLVITNVPYLTRGKQDDTLRDYCEKHYNAGKNDLATTFLDRCLEFCCEGATSSIVLPQNWLFLITYKNFRMELFKNDSWHLVARLGPGAFETITGEVVKAILLTISRGNVLKSDRLTSSTFSGRLISGLDVSEFHTAKKAEALICTKILQVKQAKQLENPDAVFSFDDKQSGPLLGKYARSLAGLDTGDSLQFKFKFWELPSLLPGWIFQVNSVNSTNLFAGREHIVLWEDGHGNLVKCPGAGLRNIGLWGSNGIYASRMGNLSATLCIGTSWDRSGTMLLPRNKADISAIWAFCSSKNFQFEIRKLNQKLSVAESTFEKVPFDINHWTKVASEKYPKGLPKPYSDDPTQWIFHGHPAHSNEPLQVAVARLMGYRWPPELDTAMELSDETRAWVKKSETLLLNADEDGIVCIPSVRGEMKAEDRLENLLAAAYGSQWSISKKSELLAKVDYAGKTLEFWLREKFFTQHCKLFHDRPFIWHIWDGLNDGFAALVNYHKLNAKLLETLTYTYLGDWITHQKQDKAQGVEGAEEKLAAAEALKKRLELILEGEKPNDIFIRWKSAEQQPIGWNPNLNDGVRLNIRPFMSVRDIGKKGAGILRDKPNISWGKDRGKNMESAPWPKLGPIYGGHEGDRINAHHLSIAEKNDARKNSVQSNSGVIHKC